MSDPDPLGDAIFECAKIDIEQLKMNKGNGAVPISEERDLTNSEYLNGDTSFPRGCEYWITEILKQSLLYYLIGGKRINGGEILKRLFNLLDEDHDTSTVIKYIHANKVITTAELINKTLIPDPNIYYAIRQLKRIGYVTKQGTVGKEYGK